MFSDRNPTTVLKQLKIGLFFLNSMYVWPIRYCQLVSIPWNFNRVMMLCINVSYRVKKLYTQQGFWMQRTEEMFLLLMFKKNQTTKPPTPTLILHDPIKNTKKAKCFCIQNDNALASNSNSVIPRRVLVKASRKNWFGNGSRYKSFSSEGVPYKINVRVSS